MENEFSGAEPIGATGKKFVKFQPGKELGSYAAQKIEIKKPYTLLVSDRFAYVW